MTKRAAIIGGGVIGGGWAARFLLNGWDVAVFDSDADAKRKIEAVIANARRSLPALYDRALPDEGQVIYCATVADAVRGADWVQESVPERLDAKHAVLADIEIHAPDDAIIGSSTSGFKPSQLNENGGRAIVAHPFNPVYLLPLVELVGDAETCARAAQVLDGIGMYPLTLRKEIDAHIADRLLEAVWRESLWLVKDGIATTEEIDQAIRMGFGLRWAQMGLFETYRIAGGEAGMKHFMEQFGPCLSWPWTKLTDVPEFNAELVELIAGQSDAQSGHLSVRDLERQRDDNLVGMIRSLKHSGSGAGAVIRKHEAALPMPALQEGLLTAERQIPQSWTDYNGHMNETHYLEIGSIASDRFLEAIGAGLDYVAGGQSYFSVENNIRYMAEVKAGEKVRVLTRLVGAKGKKVHIYHQILGGDDGLRATVETLCVHVDLTTRRSSLPAPQVAQAIEVMLAEHAKLPAPPPLAFAV